jgi:hypothetical protein
MNLSLEYFGGLFDGEGHIGISLSKGKSRNRMQQHMLVCSMGMTHEPVIRSFQEAFGGCVCKPEKMPSGKSLWRWKTSNLHAYGFVKIIREYLFVKREQAELAIKFCESKVKIRPLTLSEIVRREFFRQQMVAMNGSTKAKRLKIKIHPAIVKIARERDTRFLDFVRLEADGATNQEIAERIGISAVHVRRMRRGEVAAFNEFTKNQ